MRKLIAQFVLLILIWEWFRSAAKEAEVFRRTKYVRENMGDEMSNQDIGIY